MSMTLKEIMESIRKGTMELDYAGHDIIMSKEDLLSDFDRKVSDAEKEKDPEMKDLLQKLINRKYFKDRPIRLGDMNDCRGCGERLWWSLEAGKLQLRFYHSKESKDLVGHPRGYLCPFANPQPTSGRIQIQSPLVFVNYFCFSQDSPYDGRDRYSREWNLGTLYGRRNITKFKEQQNIAYGQMGNTSIKIYVNSKKDSIIVGPYYHPAESLEYESESEYYKAISEPVFPDYKPVDGIHLAIWRWEASDLDTIGKENFSEMKEKHTKMVQIDVPHGTWIFKHFYDTNTNPNKHIYTEFALLKSS